MVVPVLMTSCHVSEKLKYGSVTAHTTIVATARAKTHARPVSRDVIWAIDEKSRLNGRSPFDPTEGRPLPILVAAPFVILLFLLRRNDYGRTMRLKGSCIIRAKFERYRANFPP